MFDKVYENRCRRKAKRLGLFLVKSKARRWSVDDHQGYRIINRQNGVEAGEKFDLSLGDVESILDDYERQLRR